jgi:two-component system phosphate regulon sensor histidine kinase PhoR
VKLGVRGQLLLLCLGLIAPTVIVAELYLQPRLEELLRRQIQADLLVRLELVEREASARILSLEDLDAWGAIASDFARRSNVQVTIVGTDFRRLGESAPARPGAAEDAVEPELVAALQHGFGQSTRFSDRHGQKMLFVAAPFRWEDVATGVVRLGLPTAELDLAVEQVRWTMLLGWALTLGAGGLGAAGLVQLVSRRVRQLTRAARRMADGDLSARTRLGGKDELGELGATLDQLAQSLSVSLAELRAERDQVRKLESSRREYVANISHELKTPLTAIRSATETLQTGAWAEPSTAIEFVDIVARNTRRLQDLVEDVLELARVESGQLKVELVPVELAPALERCAESLRDLALRRTVALKLEAVPPGLSAIADRRALDQVLGNLVHNAIRFTPPGGAVALRAVRDGASVRLEIEDQGPGIAPDQQARIFERFYRIDDGRSRDVGGSGLGLAIVRQLAEAMHGSAGVRSAVGAGSTFWCALPAAKGASNGQPYADST